MEQKATYIAELHQLLREIRTHAAATESELWAIDSKLKELLHRREYYESQIVDRFGVRVLQQYLADHGIEPLHRQHSGSAPSPSSVRFAPVYQSNLDASSPSSVASSTDEQVWEQQNHALRRKLQYFRDELRKDQEAKLRLLDAVAYKLNGVPKMTLADHAVLAPHPSSTSLLTPAVASMLRLLKVLPEGNLDALKRNEYFEYCRAMMREAIKQHQRLGAVDVEACALKAAHSAGVSAVTVNAMASISLDDLREL